MAGVLLKYGNSSNVGVCKYVVDTDNEVNDLPTTTRGGVGQFQDVAGFNVSIPMGSTVETGTGNTYELFSNGWTIISSNNSNSLDFVAEDVSNQFSFDFDTTGVVVNSTLYPGELNVFYMNVTKYWGKIYRFEIQSRFAISGLNDGMIWLGHITWPEGTVEPPQTESGSSFEKLYYLPCAINQELNETVNVNAPGMLVITQSGDVKLEVSNTLKIELNTEFVMLDGGGLIIF